MGNSALAVKNSGFVEHRTLQASTKITFLTRILYFDSR